MTHSIWSKGETERKDKLFYVSWSAHMTLERSWTLIESFLKTSFQLSNYQKRVHGLSIPAQGHTWRHEEIYSSLWTWDTRVKWWWPMEKSLEFKERAKLTSSWSLTRAQKFFALKMCCKCQVWRRIWSRWGSSPQKEVSDVWTEQSLLEDWRRKASHRWNVRVRKPVQAVWKRKGVASGKVKRRCIHEWHKKLAHRNLQDIRQDIAITTALLHRHMRRLSEGEDVASAVWKSQRSLSATCMDQCRWNQRDESATSWHKLTWRVDTVKWSSFVRKVTR